MNKEMRYKAWAALPKELRDEVRKAYSANYSTKLQADAVRCTLSVIFGDENLETATEPDEVLCVKRSEIIDFYDIIGKHIDNCRKDKMDEVPMLGVQAMLFGIFGNKCVKDGEPPQTTERPSETKERPSEKPQFDVGDKVRVKAGYYAGSVGKIALIYDETQRPFVVVFGGGDSVLGSSFFDYDELELYVEPETQRIVLSDAELDEVIARLTAIRDRRRKNDNELSNIIKAYTAQFA